MDVTGDAPELSGQLRLAVVRLNRRLRAQRPGDGITLTQLSALSTLHHGGAMTPSELAASEQVRPPSMTRVIASLEECGLVSRAAHATDGRQSILQLTPDGVAFLEAETSARERWLDKRLAQLSAEERGVLAAAAEIIDRMAGS